jgi:Uroporphyrinogen decarboxylase (URO-D)
MILMNNSTKATGLDVKLGKPANGLIWGLSATIDDQLPPTKESFVTRNGRKFLRSAAFERMKSRQKDRAPLFYETFYHNVDYAETEDGEHDVFSWHTPLGNVVGRRHDNHFNEYPVKTVFDIDIWTHIYRNIRFQPNQAWLNNHDCLQKTGFGLKCSPVQQLIQFDMGLENFYYFLMDAPEKMSELLDVMQERCMDRLRLGLSLFPNTSWVCWGENTSSTAISPSYYQQLTLPHIQAYAQLIHQNNARLIVHMCGLLSPLLDCFLETGMDGIHSVTPPPLGDAPYALIRETFGQDFTITGRFNAQLWVGKSKTEIQANIKQNIYPELLASPFNLAVTDDAMPDIPYDDVMTLYDALETIKW